MNIKKCIFFTVLALLLFSTPGSAEDAEEWELTFEDHPYDSNPSIILNPPSSVVSIAPDADIENNLLLRSTYRQGPYFYFYNAFPEYLSFTFRLVETQYSSTDSTFIRLQYYTESGGYLETCQYPFIERDSRIYHHVSFQSDGSYYNSLYIDGSLIGGDNIPSNAAYILFLIQYSSDGSGNLRYTVDDFSSTPFCVGIDGYVKPSDSAISATFKTPVTPGYSYYAMLLDPHGATVSRWNISSPHDFFLFTPTVTLDETGLYYLYIYGQDDKLYYSKPFLYTSAEVPADMVFKVSGTLNADIRDALNQGGEIESGGGRYLYMTEDEGGNYPVNITLLENAYSFRYTHEIAYAMHEVNSTQIAFEGLQSNYQVTLDGQAFPGATAATGIFTFSGNLSDGDLLNISADWYEFDNEGNTTPGTISVPLNASNLTISTSNLLSKIQSNGTADISANLNTTGNITPTGNITLNLTANIPGTAGNLIPISTNATNISASGPYMTGGTDDLGYTNGASTWTYNITNWTSTTEHIFEFTPDLTKPGVYGYVKDPDTQQALRTATVTIFNDSASFVLWTDSNGMYYKTTDLEAGQTYSVKAAKSGYTTFEGSATTKTGATTKYDFFLSPEEGSGLYYSPHYVQFIIESYLGGSTYPGVNVTVYTDSTRETEFGSKLTDSRGIVGWEMSPDKVYYFTITGPEQGINKEISICPGVETIIHIPVMAGSSYEAPDSVYDDLNWVIYKNQVNLSSGFINVSVEQTTSETVTTNITITDMNSTALYTHNYTTTPVNYSVLVPTNQSYIVFVDINHPDHDPVKLQKSVTWNMGINPDFDLGWEKQWQYSILAAISMILIVMLFPASLAHIGGLLGCGVGAFHLFVTGWLPTDTINIIFAFLAIMLAFMFNFRKQEVLR